MKCNIQLVFLSGVFDIMCDIYREIKGSGKNPGVKLRCNVTSLCNNRPTYYPDIDQLLGIVLFINEIYQYLNKQLLSAGRLVQKVV